MDFDFLQDYNLAVMNVGPAPTSPHHSAVYSIVLGQVLAVLREQRGWTQTQVAQAMGMSQAALSRIERGQALPDSFQFDRFAALFGMTSAALQTYVQAVWLRTEEATWGALKQQHTTTPWWEVAVQVAGIVGVAGLVAFAVAVVLKETKTG